MLVENEALTALDKLPTDKNPTSSSKTINHYLERPSTFYLLVMKHY